VVGTLANVPVTRLLTSPYRRCWETLMPLAAARSLNVERCDLLAPEAPLEQVLAMLAEPAAEGAVLCTHGELLEAILDRWEADGPVRLRRRVRSKKGGLWLVEGPAGEHETARYRAARRVEEPPGNGRRKRS
jgi:phosphohistidine phosphatase SixA